MGMSSRCDFKSRDTWKSKHIRTLCFDYKVLLEPYLRMVPDGTAVKCFSYVGEQ